MPSRIGANPPGAHCGALQRASSAIPALCGRVSARRCWLPAGMVLRKREALRQYQNFAGAVATGYLLQRSALKLHVMRTAN